MIEETQKVRAAGTIHLPTRAPARSIMSRPWQVRLIRTGKAPRMAGPDQGCCDQTNQRGLRRLVLTAAGMKSYQAASLVTSTHLLITTKSIDDVHLKSSATHAITIAGRVDTRREWNQSASRGIEELAVLNHSNHGEQIIPPACQR